MSKLLNKFAWIAWVVALLSCGYAYYMYTHPIVQEKIVTKDVVKEVIKYETVTEVVAQEKENVDDADVELNTKSFIKVKLNGEEVQLKPEGKDYYTFGKDFVKLNQENKVSVDLNVKPLEPSWGIGVGYSNNKKVAGLATVRIKETPFYVWGMTDGTTHAGGIMFNANFK